MAEMVTVGGIRYRKDDAARENLTADSKAYREKIATGEAPVGVTEKVFKASNPDDGKRKAAGGRDDVNGTKTLVTSATGNQRAGRKAGDDSAGTGADGKPGDSQAGDNGSGK